MGTFLYEVSLAPPVDKKGTSSLFVYFDHLVCAEICFVRKLLGHSDEVSKKYFSMHLFFTKKIFFVVSLCAFWQQESGSKFRSG